MNSEVLPVKKVTIKFEESSKAVTSHVTMEQDDDCVDCSELLEATKRLFEEAQKYSAFKTMQKVR